MVGSNYRHLVSVCALLSVANALAQAQSVQLGFYDHGASNIKLSNAAVGELCTDGEDAVCEAGMKVVISGEETCDYSETQQYPCTRYGYTFDYADARPGTTLDCTRTTYSPAAGEQLVPYQRPVSDESGRISYTSFRTYAPVDERVILSEVHDCEYRGERVATIEFMLYYEPGVGGPGSSGETADQYFAEVPNACSDPYLTEDTAADLLRATSVRKHAASEHIPILQSQCFYGASSGQKGRVGYVFKFMLSDMFDVDKLVTQQVDFNATFANGGTSPNEIIEGLGDRAYIFINKNRATVFVITGIKGRKDFAGRSNEFVAQYYIDHPDMDAASKQGRLLEQARLHLSYWAQ